MLQVMVATLIACMLWCFWLYITCKVTRGDSFVRNYNVGSLYWLRQTHTLLLQVVVRVRGIKDLQEAFVVVFLVVYYM